jgi:tol-pal system protein YbgF
MQLFKRLGLATTLSLAVFAAQAETLPEVSEARSRNANTAPQLSANADSFEIAQQMQWLQEELQNMRGQLELAEHEIEQLQTRQRDLYADLDQRISEIRQDLAKAESAAKPEVQAAAMPEEPEAVAAQEQAALAAAAAAVVAEADADQAAYNSAYELLQRKRYTMAIDAFDDYLAEHPEGQYAANAYYWLGETHVIYDDLERAEESFQAVIEQYPLHQKAQDAMLKLGYVYDSTGDQEKAIATLTEVKTKYPNSSAARLAEQRVIQIKQRTALDPMSEL